MTFDAPVVQGEEPKSESAISDLTEAALNELNNVAPESVKTYIKTAKDAVAPATSFLEAQMPKLLRLYDSMSGLYASSAKYQSKEALQICVGLLMVFFGGTFGATIAAVETFRHIALADTKEALKILYKQYEIADRAAEKDERKNPLPSTAKESDQREVELRRRAFLIFKSVDPNAISKAVSAITSGAFGVLCALRVKFAHAVALGISIGDMTTGLFQRYGTPKVKSMLPEDLHKWVPLLSNYLCRSLAVSLAWTFQLIIIAFHASLRGANLVLDGVVALLMAKGMMNSHSVPPKESARWHAMVYCVAGFGFLYQAKSGFSVPFPLNLFLWPISLVEFTLKLVVGTYGI